MKRMFALLLILVLAAAGTAVAEDLTQTFATPYYALSIPAGWTIDTSDLKSDKDYEELGLIYSPDDPGLTVDASLSYYSDMKDVSLWKATDAQMQDYIDKLTKELEDYEGRYVSTLQVGRIPFVVFHASDEYGPYYYVDTMTNGYAVVFYVYDYNYGTKQYTDPTEAEWSLFERILSTFVPVA